MMENRSFDHMFGLLDRPDLPPLQVGTHPNPLSLEPGTVESFTVTDHGEPHLPVDPPHSYRSVVEQLHRDPNGENDGFVAAYFEKASGHEKVAKIHWIRIGVALGLLAGALCAAAYLLGDRWFTTALMVVVMSGVIFFTLWGFRGLIPKWGRIAAQVIPGAVAVGLLARSMRHEWWAAGLVFLVLVGA